MVPKNPFLFPFSLFRDQSNRLFVTEVSRPCAYATHACEYEITGQELNRSRHATLPSPASTPLVSLCPTSEIRHFTLFCLVECVFFLTRPYESCFFFSPFLRCMYFAYRGAEWCSKREMVFDSIRIWSFFWFMNRVVLGDLGSESACEGYKVLAYHLPRVAPFAFRWWYFGDCR